MEGEFLPIRVISPHGRGILHTARRVMRAEPAVSPSGKVIVMAKSTNGKRRSTVRPAPNHSSLRSMALNRSANVTEYDIARRASDLYLARDCEDGHDLDDWLQAERELQGEEHP